MRIKNTSWMFRQKPDGSYVVINIRSQIPSFIFKPKEFTLSGLKRAIRRQVKNHEKRT